MLYFNYYDIKIGELEIREDRSSYSIGVAHTKSEDCNFFGSDNNYIRVNYDIYREFVRKIDEISDDFSNYFIAGECKSSSDTFVVTEKDLEILSNLRDIYFKKYLDVKVLRKNITGNELENSKDYFFTLLNFMIFWTNWAIGNCEKPAFYITLKD